MGVLDEGKPLTWSEIKNNLNTIKNKYLNNFISLYFYNKDNTCTGEYFGEEIEYSLYNRDNSTPFIGASSLIQKLNELSHTCNTTWHPEYGDWMIEGVSEYPYSLEENRIFLLEYNLLKRRRLLNSILESNIISTTLSIPPKLSRLENYENNTYSRSTLISDKLINPHIRFSALTQNIREKRGKKVHIPVGVKNHPNTIIKNKIGDAMAFGMGCSCLQITLEAESIYQSLEIFDLLQPFSSLMLLLSSSSPLYEGILKHGNTRWDIISKSVHDGEKSRYDYIPCYMSSKGLKYNDAKITTNNEIYKILIDLNIPEGIALYISHIFSFDPLLVFTDDKYNFKSFQSTVWQNLRWKIPSKLSESWRVEFRPMELQLTDKENAALILYTVLYTKACLKYKIDYFINASKLLENLSKVVNCTQLVNIKLWWKINQETKLYNISNIIYDINEKIYRYLDDEYPHLKTFFKQYIEIITKRATGNCPTSGDRLKLQIIKHQEYNWDSILNSDILNDLTRFAHLVGINNHY